MNTEKRVQLAVQALFPPDEERNDGSYVDYSADGNLEAVIIDLEARGADKTCISSLASIGLQLAAARAALLDGK